MHVIQVIRGSRFSLQEGISSLSVALPITKHLLYVHHFHARPWYPRLSRTNQSSVLINLAFGNAGGARDRSCNRRYFRAVELQNCVRTRRVHRSSRAIDHGETGCSRSESQFGRNEIPREAQSRASCNPTKNDRGRSLNLREHGISYVFPITRPLLCALRIFRNTYGQ